MPKSQKIKLKQKNTRTFTKTVALPPVEYEISWGEVKKDGCHAKTVTIDLSKGLLTFRELKEILSKEFSSPDYLFCYADQDSLVFSETDHLGVEYLETLVSISCACVKGE